MHGHAGPVERKIRLWIVQQERNRRKERQLGRAEVRGEGPVERRRHSEDLRGSAQWQ
jgi:hypothetical protein